MSTQLAQSWEWTLLGIILLTGLTGITVYKLCFEWILMRANRRWFYQQLGIPRTPIYGPANPYRVKGPNARQNVRV